MAEGSITITGVINLFQGLCTRRISNPDAIYKVDNEIPFCVKGAELHSSDANSHTIERGLHQLRWAAPQLVSEILRGQATALHDDDLRVEILCPILVTTASLHVFREGLTLQEFQNTADLESVAEQVNALVVSRERGPQLNKYLRNIIGEFYKQNPGVRVRLEQLAEILLTAKERTHLSSTWHFDESIDSISTRILVVNFDAFEGIVTNILDAIKVSGRSLKRRAKLEFDRQNKSLKILPLLKR